MGWNDLILRAFEPNIRSFVSNHNHSSTMKKLTLCIIVFSTIFLSACADMMQAKQKNAPEPSPQSNAQRAENLSNAVQRCVGMGLSVGSPLYETCVKNQLK
jgi:hypothetical protein